MSTIYAYAQGATDAYFLSRFQVERHTEKELEALLKRTNHHASARGRVEPAKSLHRPYPQRHLGLLASLLAPILKLT